MNEIRSLLRVASRRLEIGSWLAQLHIVAVVIASLALLLMIGDRLPAEGFVPWTLVGPALAGIVLALSLPLWMRRRRSETQVAIEVDERLDLREKLSTALHCAGRNDPFAQAAVEDGVRAATDRRHHELARRRFRVEAPRGWWLSPMLILAALMLSLVEPLDLFAVEEEAQDDMVTRNAATEVTANIEQVGTMLRDADSEELKKLAEGLTAPETDAQQATSPEDIRRGAMKKLTDMQKKLEEILRGEDGQTAETLRRSLKQLKVDDKGPASELGKALASGDFAKAQKALEDLKKGPEDGKLSKEQQDQLQEQLQDLAKQLEQLAQQQQQLAQALQQAGLDPQLAQNPQALQQALNNNPNLNQQQIQQLQQMAQAQQAAQQACQKMGQACQGMAQQLAQNGQLGQGAQQMGDQLNQLEQMQMMLQQAAAAANACQGQRQGIGQNMAQKQQGQGGMGQWGQGRGGTAPIAPAPWKSKIVKANVHTDPNGDIIARMLIEGMPQNPGESTVTARQVELKVSEGYDEAIAEENVPMKYQDANKHYFGELKKLTEARDAPEPEAESDD